MIPDQRPQRPARFLARAEAAAYLGVSPRTFDAEVTEGLWPSPLPRGGRGGRLTWDVRALDKAADRISGLVATLSEEVPSWAEAAALERAANGTTKTNRNKYRNTQAA
jgi:hypothetical protein